MKPIVRHLMILLLVAGLCQLHAASHPNPSTTVHIPMRDGTELTADLYYPSESIITNEYPCILVRLPAGRKAASWLPLTHLSQHGYVVALQDTRSALDEEGKTFPYFSDGWDEQQDGLDTINWLASSSFTNGKIGTAGYSACGMTQLMLAPTAPPALKCQYVGQAGGSLYHHAIFIGGQLQKNQVETWLGLYASDPSVIKHVLSQPIYNDFWQKVDAVSQSHLVNTPAVHYGGWFDPFLEGTIETYAARQTNGCEGCRQAQKLLIGPWTHFWPLDYPLGEYPVPENGKAPPIDISATRWFDFYLKDAPNGAADLPTVTYYVMGPADGSPSSGNVWRHSDSWPVPAINTTLFLTADNKLHGQKSTNEKVFAYVSDPENPVPTLGGRNLFIPSGPIDQRPIENRKDVIVFTGDPLQDDVEVTGKIIAKLFFAADTPDTDIAVRLTDVYPDGKSLLVAEGYVRTGIIHKDKDFKNPQEVSIDLWSTSQVFAKGHSIRVSIAGSNYPRYEKNIHNDSSPANCKVSVGGAYPSCVVLPTVRRGKQWLVTPQPESSPAQNMVGL